MEIVTGKVGTPHVSSADSRALNAAIIGTGNYVLNVGSKFSATIETSNNIVIADGDLVINGTHARIPHGDNDTVIIENGTTGYNRIDLIVARYTKKSDIESVELAVIKGETVAGTPTRPSYTSGNVLADAEIAEMPLYAVQLAGVNVASITPLFTISTGLDDVYRKNEVYTKGEVDTIKQNLQKNINTAQSTANTGVANAAAAQNTANTGVANAAAAQSTANTARQEAAAAQNTANLVKQFLSVVAASENIFFSRDEGLQTITFTTQVPANTQAVIPILRSTGSSVYTCHGVSASVSGTTATVSVSLISSSTGAINTNVAVDVFCFGIA